MAVKMAHMYVELHGLLEAFVLALATQQQ